MYKRFALITIVGFLLSACAGFSPAPTVTPIPSPTATPLTPPFLIREIKLETKTGTAYTLAWSPDGNLLAVASGGEITLISRDLRKIRAVFRLENSALGITWNPDQTQFASVNGYRSPAITIWGWDGNDQFTVVQQVQVDSDQYGVSWSPDGTMLATLEGDAKSVIQIWDASTWEKIQTFNLPYTKPRRALQWSPDSSRVFGAGEANRSAVFFALNIADGTIHELGQFPPEDAEVFTIAATEDRFAVASALGVVRIIDVKTGDVLTGMKSVNQPVDIAWSPNGKTLAILDYKTMLQLWDVSK